MSHQDESQVGVPHPDKSEKHLTDVNIDALHSHEAEVELDAAGRFLAEQALLPDGEYLTGPYTEEEEKAVKRKADMIVLPLLFWSLSMGAVDKVALGTAGVLNIRKDLGLVGQQFSWASSLIFFGQLISVFPALFIMQKFQTGKVIGANVVIWGIISMCIAACKNFAGLAVCRFMLGFFESLTFPGFSLVVGSWYTRSEQTTRLAILFNTFSSITNGILSFACSHIDHEKFAQWRALFLLVGGITFLLGILMLLFLPNSPMTAPWLTPRQRCIAVMRVQSNKTGISNKTFKKHQLVEALTDPKSWLIFLCNVGLNIPNGGTATFSSIIINGLGFNPRKTMLLQIPTGVFSWVSSLICAWIAYKIGHRTVVAFCAGIIPLIATILLKEIPRSNRGGSMASLYLVYLYWAPYSLMNAQMVANTGGNTKKTVSYGIGYCGYLVGNIIGPQTFLAKQAPKYTGGVVAMLVGYIVALAMIALYYFYLRFLMAQKKKQLEREGEGVTEDQGVLRDWHDQTDKENPTFVYHT